MSDIVLNRFRLGPWLVIRDRNRIERTAADGSPVIVRLEPKAIDVLCALAGDAGQTLLREELLDRVWEGRPVVEGTLSRVILSLRQALGDDARSPTYIETVQKRGYRLLVMPVAAGDLTAESDVSAESELAAATVGEGLPVVSAAVPDAVVATPAAVANTDAPPIPPLVDATTGRRPARWLTRAGAVALATAAVVWIAWPRIQLERATSSGLDAILFRGEKPADRHALREELRYMRSGRVLWVDDEPANNRREITTLEQAGLVVDTVTSNAAAADQMRGREYDVIISDIRRPPPESATAGLDLPRVVVPDRNRLPPLVYYVHHANQPRTVDGYPVTNKASDLLRIVSNVFRWKQTEPRIRPLGAVPDAADQSMPKSK